MRRAYTIFAAALIVAATSGGCMQAYYSFWQTFGKQKRELLQENVADARDDQKRVTEDFKDALTTLQAAYGSSGTKLEAVYRDLQANYDGAEGRAKDLHDRIDKVERIADDLFREWDGEIAQLHSAKYKASSRRKLDDTKRRFAELDRSMRRAERGIAPVLVTLKDQVLYLKHNLDAETFDQLHGETAGVESGIARLVAEMQQSIAASNDFLATLERPGAVAH